MRISDWSSDVCSSDLLTSAYGDVMHLLFLQGKAAGENLSIVAVLAGDRPGVVAVRADLGSQGVVDAARPWDRAPRVDLLEGGDVGRHRVHAGADTVHIVAPVPTDAAMDIPGERLEIGRASRRDRVG